MPNPNQNVVTQAEAEQYVLVPREPTEAMLKAGQSAADDKRWAWCGYGKRQPGEGLDGMLFYVRDAYAAMLSASPSRGAVRHPEDQCQECGRAYPAWIAPSPLWNAVMRGGSINGPWKGCECVCSTCFMLAAEEAGIAGDWKVIARKVNVELETVTPSGRVWDDAQDLWVEPSSGAAIPAAKELAQHIETLEHLSSQYLPGGPRDVKGALRAAINALKPTIPTEGQREAIARLCLAHMFGFEFSGESMCDEADRLFVDPNPRISKSVALADAILALTPTASDANLRDTIAILNKQSADLVAELERERAGKASDDRLREALEKIDANCAPFLCSNCAANRSTARTALECSSREGEA